MQRNPLLAPPGFVARLVMLLGGLQLAPLLVLLRSPQDAMYAPAFLLSALIGLLCGVLLHVAQAVRGPGRWRGRQDGVVAVVGVWLYAFVLGGLPFFFAGRLTLFRAVFESVSGWTATGFTTMDVTATPDIFLFYRSFMQFTGGIGFVLLILMFSGGAEAMRLFSAEGHTDKLEPNLVRTARLMMGIYAAATALGTLAYIACGMGPFDAINHAMSAMATGGFSTRAGSIGYYNSVPIEAVTIVLMLVGGTNFSILALLVKGQLKRFAKIGEVRFAAVLLVLGVAAVAALGTAVYTSVGESVRVAAFQMVSALTSTGYSVAGFDVWTAPMRLLIILFMLIGGGTGSTAGGMKYSRVYILWRSFHANLRRKFQPEHLVREETVVRPREVVRLTNDYQLTVHHFAIVYLVAWFLGTLALTLAGLPLEQAQFEFASALGTIGLSTGATGAQASNAVLAIQLVGMVLARLEVYIVLLFLRAIYERAKAAVLCR